MTGRYGKLDYPRLVKRGFLLGLSLFLVGALGEFAIHAALVQVPAWEETLLFDAEVLGILLMFFSPVIFGVALPLTE